MGRKKKLKSKIFIESRVTPPRKQIVDPIIQNSAFWCPYYLEQSAWLEHIPFAFWLVQAHKPSIFVELGTHYGASYFAFCQAVSRLGLDTRCYAVDTWKGDEHAGLYDEKVFNKVNSHNEAQYSAFSRLVRSTFDEALPHFDDGSIDLLHIDGFHSLEAVTYDFETWLPKLSERAVVILHDTNVRERGFGVFQLFKELCNKYPNFEFYHGHGLGVLGVGENQNKLMERLYQLSNSSSDKQATHEVFGRLGRACADNWAVSEYQERLAKGSDIILEKDKQINVAKQALNVNNEELKKLSQELAELEQGRRVSVEKHALERGYLVDKISLLQESRKDYKRDIGKLYQSLEHGNTELGETRAALESLTLENESLRDVQVQQAQTASEAVAQLTDELAQQTAALESAAVDNEALRQAQTQQAQAASKAVAQLTDELTQQTAALESAAVDNEVMRQAQTQQAQKASKTVAQLTDELAQQTVALESALVDNEVLRQTQRKKAYVAAQQIDKLEKQCEALQCVGLENEALIEIYAQKELANSDNLFKLTQEFKRQGEELTSSISENDSLFREIEVKNIEIAKIYTEVSSDKSKFLSIEKSNSALNSELQCCVTRYKRCVNEIVELTTLLQEKDDSCREVTHLIDDLRNNLSRNQCELEEEKALRRELQIRVNAQQQNIETVQKLAQSLKIVQRNLDEKIVLTNSLENKIKEQSQKLNARIQEIAVLTKLLEESEVKKNVPDLASNSHRVSFSNYSETSEVNSPKGVFKRVKFKYITIRQQVKLIEKSGFFDKKWYLEHYPDIEKEVRNYAEHYVQYGAKEGRNPGPRFNSLEYLKAYPDVVREGVNPLVHYIKHGKKEGRIIYKAT